MKSYKILLFVLLVIAALGVIVAFFPKESIKIGNTELHFPSFDDLAKRDTTQKEIELPTIDSAALQAMMALQDTMAVYRQIITQNEGRFFFPNQDSSFFDSFFASANKAQQQGRLIRILHYGDSQIEMDRMSDNLRVWFQKNFGGGGPGMIPLMQTIPTTSVSQSVSGNLTDYGLYGDAAGIKDRQYGPMARFYRVSGTTILNVSASKNAKTDDRFKNFSHITLLYKDKTGNFSATLKDRVRQTEEKQISDTTGIRKMVWVLDSVTARVSLTLSGEADIYGVTIDNGYGVTLDNIPIRGSSGTFFSQIEDSTLRVMYNLLDVGLIILQFGGNSVPAIQSDKAIFSYTDKIASQIRYFQRVCPKAKILFIGPSDMSTRVGGVLQTYPRLPDLVEALKMTVTENGAVFWDMYSVMGGYNSMLTWVRNGWAGNDYIHFSSGGAKKMSDALANTFQIMYNYYLLRQEMETQHPENTQNN